jgi:hypothetical protein
MAVACTHDGSSSSSSTPATGGGAGGGGGGGTPSGWTDTRPFSTLSDDFVQFYSRQWCDVTDSSRMYTFRRDGWVTTQGAVGPQLQIGTTVFKWKLLGENKIEVDLPGHENQVGQIQFIHTESQINIDLIWPDTAYNLQSCSRYTNGLARWQKQLDSATALSGTPYDRTVDPHQVTIDRTGYIEFQKDVHFTVASQVEFLPGRSKVGFKDGQARPGTEIDSFQSNQLDLMRDHSCVLNFNELSGPLQQIPLPADVTIPAGTQLKIDGIDQISDSRAWWLNGLKLSFSGNTLGAESIELNFPSKGYDTTNYDDPEDLLDTLNYCMDGAAVLKKTAAP